MRLTAGCGAREVIELSDVLSQAEIEALLRQDDEVPSETGPPPPVRGGGLKLEYGGSAGTTMATDRTVAYEPYDFRRPDKLSKDQLRTLQMLHETFARMAASSLSAYLRTPVNIELISFEQVPYEEYLRSINQSVFTIMSLQPLSGQAVLEVEFELIFTIIDRMLGGAGKAIKRTVLTEIERPLVQQTVERLFGALKTAWEGVVVVNPLTEGMETSSQFVQVAPPSDIVVTILFEVRVGEQRGAMSLCIPYLVLKPVAAKLSAQKWFASGTRRVTEHTRRELCHQVQHSSVECQVRLGKARIAVQDLLKLAVGDVVRLDQPTNQDLVFLVGNVPKLHGRPALSGNKVVFAVTSHIEP